MKSKIINFAILYLAPVAVFAQTTIDINIKNPAGSNTNLMDIINALVKNVAMPIGAVLVVLYIIYAGFTFVSAQGNPKEIENAKSRLLWALVGAAILLGAVAISAAVKDTITKIVS